jgi:hypothetical protein
MIILDLLGIIPKYLFSVKLTQKGPHPKMEAFQVVAFAPKARLLDGQF